MSRRSARRGIKRLDVLVVVVGIVLLLAWLWPAVRVSRDPSWECHNNLEQITMALQAYHDSWRVFPMGVMHSGPNPGGSPPVAAGLGPSWWFGLLPFMEQNQMYEDIIASQLPGAGERPEFCADDIKEDATAHPYSTGRGKRVRREAFDRWAPKYMRCSRSPLPVMETRSGPIALPSYVGIAGGCDIDPESQDYLVRGDEPSGLVAPKTDRLYRNRHKGTGATAGGIVTSSGMLPPCEHVGIANCTDGTSNTMIVAEQSDWLLDRDPASSQQYHGDPGWTVGGTGRGGGWLSGTTRVDRVPKIGTPGGPPAPWGADCWNITTVRYPPNFKRVMGAAPLPGCSENHGINNPLQSPHPGVVRVGMVDGFVQHISQTTDLAVLLRLAIRDDGQNLLPP